MDISDLPKIKHKVKKKQQKKSQYTEHLTKISLILTK